MSEYRPAFVARKGNPGFGWVVDVLWPDGETEVVKGFATEQQAAEWIAKHSEDWQGKTNPTCAESTPHNNRINGLAKKLALHF
jgi:hypothetical protein